MNDILFIDFESLYSSKDDYTLKKMSVREYVMNPRFKVWGAAVAYGSAKPVWLSGQALTDYLAGVNWANTTVVAHNVKFDGAILEWKYGHSPLHYVCTQSLSRAVNGYTVPFHALGKLALQMGLSQKGEMKTDGLYELSEFQENELAEYCIRDVEICQQLYNELIAAFPETELDMLDWTIRAFVRPQLVLAKSVLEDLNETEKTRRQDIFDEIGIPKSVFASNDQFPALLREKGYEVPMKKSPKRKNADGTAMMIPALALGDEAFQELINNENEELQALCEARIAAKSTLLETRSAKFIDISKIGAFPFDVQYSGAQQTHRFSGGSGAGGNPQNLQRCQNSDEHKTGHHCRGQLRRAVCAPQGKYLVVGDFAAIEARIVAWLAKEPTLIKAFSDDADVYSQFASIVYGRPINKLDHPAERRFGKEGILGLGYGMGPEKFQKRVKLVLGKTISTEEAEDTVGLYRATYSNIPLLWRTLQEALPLLLQEGVFTLPGIPFLRVHDGAIWLPSGLALQYPGLYYEDVPGAYGRMRREWYYKPYRKGRIETHKLYGAKLLENITQALAGEACKEAIRTAEACGLPCVGQVHDEIIGITTDSEKGAATLRSAMESPMPWMPELKLKAEVHTGLNWADAKEPTHVPV